MSIPQIIPRTTWGARHDDGDLTLSRLGEGVAIHHTVTATLSPDASPESERVQMRLIESIGEERFGTGISYNVLIFPSGRAYQGVSFNRRGTHTGGMNSIVRSLCFVGNYEANAPTAQQLATARALLAYGVERWWSASAWVRGHRDLKQTACPGQHVYRHMGSFRSALEDGAVIVPIDNWVPRDPGMLQADGWFGPLTATRLQAVLGTTRDGVISSQWKDTPARTDRLTAFEWVAQPRGSQVIARVQGRLGVKTDGVLGPATTRHWQRELNVRDDGVFGPKTTEALQRSLNSGKVIEA